MAQIQFKEAHIDKLEKQLSATAMWMRAHMLSMRDKNCAVQQCCKADNDCRLKMLPRLSEVCCYLCENTAAKPAASLSTCGVFPCPAKKK